MNEQINDIFSVLGGNKDFRVSIEPAQLLMMVAGIFIAMLLAVIIGMLIVAKIKA